MKYETEIDFNSRNTVTIFIDLIKNNSKVLEFGAASGRLTKYLKEEKACKVSIVEIDEEAAKIAVPYTESHVIGDIMDYGWMDEFAGQQFDYILFADVLEHLLKPEEVLAKVKKFLKEDGKILISLPNIAYNGVLLSLYENNFAYSEVGILDNTHLRFWALDEAERIFRGLGYGIELIDATYNPLSVSEFGTVYESLPSVVGNHIKSRVYGELYQMVFVLSKRKDVKTIDRTLKHTDYLFVQCFWGAGEGWDICKNIKYPVTLNNYQFCEEIAVSKDAKLFRLDPLNVPCVVRVKVTDQTGKELSAANTNGNQVENVFCFDHGDPQIIYQVEPESKNILKIEIEYMMYNNDTIYKWICDSLKKRNSIIEQKENYIVEQREALEECGNQIKRMKEMVEQKENYINEQRGLLEQRDNEIREIGGIVEQEENYINEQRDILLQKENCINEQRDVLLQKENCINEQTGILLQKEKKLKRMEQFLEKKGMRYLYKILMGRYEEEES